jgi:hypothetical protein
MIAFGTQRKRSTLLTFMFAITVFQSLQIGSFAFIAANRKVPQVTPLHLFNFLNEGKNALVRSMAGEYDAVAVRNRMGVVNLVDHSKLTLLVDIGLHRSEVD